MSDIVRTAVIIKEEDQFLLIQEGTPKVYGLWNWPQGMIEMGEDLETCAVREVREETGFDVELKEKITILHNPFPGTSEIHVYLGQVKGGTLNVRSGEILQAKWFTLEEVGAIKDQLSGVWVWDVISSL